jgi:hypothetical protein
LILSSSAHWKKRIHAVEVDVFIPCQFPPDDKVNNMRFQVPMVASMKMTDSLLG